MSVTLTEWQVGRARGFIAKGWTLAETAMILGCSKEEVMDALELTWTETIERKEKTSIEYREGYTNGYRMALAHVRMHGLRPGHENYQRVLVPWSKEKEAGVPPAFGIVYRKWA